MFYLWYFCEGLHIDLLVVLFPFPWVVWCVTLVFWKKGSVAIFLADWARLVGILYTMGIFWNFDELVGLVCFVPWKKDLHYYLVFYTILSKLLHFYCLYLRSDLFCLQ